MSKKGASRRKHEEEGWERLTNTIGIGLKGAPKKKSEVDIDSATPEDVRQWMIVQYDKYIELEGTKNLPANGGILAQDMRVGSQRLVD